MPGAGEAITLDDGKTNIKKKTRYDFEADEISGTFFKPAKEDILGSYLGRTGTLIRIRADFYEEMLKSVDNI